MEKSASHHDQKKKKPQQQRKFRIWRRKVIISEGFGPKISIFEKVENLIFLRSEIIFGHQIFIPEQSEMVRELKNIESDDLWKNQFFHPMLTQTWGKMMIFSGRKLIFRSSYQDGSEI